MKNPLLKMLVAVSCIAMIGSVAGVYATWNYTQNLPTDDAQAELTSQIVQWTYLPGAEGDQTVDIGENHNTLIEEILQH